MSPDTRFGLMVYGVVAAALAAIGFILWVVLDLAGVL